MKIYIYLWVGILFLGICQNITNTSSIEPITVSPQPKYTQTDIVISTLTPHLTVTTAHKLKPTKVVTSALFRTSKLLEGGHLWSCTKNSYSCHVYDLSNGTTDKVSIPNECVIALLQHTTQTLCQNSINKNQLYLYNLLTKDRLNLPILDTNRYGWSPNGQYLFYNNTNKTDIYQDFMVYNISSGITHTIATTVNPDDWYNGLKLSSNGEYLGGVKKVWPDSRFIEILQNTTVYTQIQEGDYTIPPWDIAWSPTTSQLIYGATDQLPLDGGPPKSNHFFTVDMKTGVSKLVLKTDDVIERSSGSLGYFNYSGDDILSSISPWSPDGTKVVIPISRARKNTDLCIISVISDSYNCFAITTDSPEDDRVYVISSPTWSPQSKQLAFWRGLKGKKERDLVIYDIGKKELMTILQDQVPSDFRLFWRER